MSSTITSSFSPSFLGDFFGRAVENSLEPHHVKYLCLSKYHASYSWLTFNITAFDIIASSKYITATTALQEAIYDFLVKIFAAIGDK